jgi:hypothetical protein
MNIKIRHPPEIILYTAQTQNDSVSLLLPMMTRIPTGLTKYGGCHRFR